MYALGPMIKRLRVSFKGRQREALAFP